jgi:hypothetical protein
MNQGIAITNGIILNHSNESLELPPKHNQMARLIALGFNYKDTAERVGVTPDRVGAIAKSPLFKSVVRQIQSELDQSVKTAQNTLIEAAPKAAEKLINIMDTSKNERLQKECANDILKGVGATRETRVEGGIHIEINENKMDLIINTLRELK